MKAYFINEIKSFINTKDEYRSRPLVIKTYFFVYVNYFKTDFTVFIFFRINIQNYII